jgi:MOSC domain-containing protein YiiM
MNTVVRGRVLGIALKTSVGGPMREVQQAEAVAGGGLVDSAAVSPDRGLTLISGPQWQEVTRELAAPALPWHTRRANLLLDLPRLGELIGRSLRIGPIVIAIKGETKPCGLMDELHAGLMNALKPEYRAGVHGRVIQGGVIRVGDVAQVV